MRAVGPIGENVVLIQNEHFAEQYSVSCLMQLDEKNLIFTTLQVASNMQVNFIWFILDCMDMVVSKMETS